jgi:hypothetical protein
MSRISPTARLSVRKLVWILLPVLILLFSAAVIINVRRHRAPVRAVRRTLDQIRRFDPEAVSMLISADDPMGTDPEQAEALQKLFAHFDYKILSCSGQGKTAEIKVRFKNIDTRALARDMRSEMLRSSLSDGHGSPGSEKTAPASAERTDSPLQNLSLVNGLLSRNEYELVSYEGSVFAVETDRHWSVSPDSSLRSLLTGFLREYLQDPYLLSAGEVLAIWLDQFSSMTEEEWASYLDAEDFFSTYARSSSEIDRLYLNLISEFYHYEIGQIDENGSEAVAQVTVTSIDMAAVLDSFRNRLIEYAGTVQSLTDDSAAMTEAAALCLTDAFRMDARSADYPVRIRLTNDGSSWQVTDITGFTDALLGNISEASEAF